MKVLRRRFGAWSAVLAVLSLAAFASTAAAATITVNSNGDTLANDGQCTLREAITAANTNSATGSCTAGSGTDTIRFSVGHPTLSRPGGDEDANSTGDVDIASNLIVSGNGAAQTTIDADGIDRVFDIASGRTATIENVKITGGRSPGGAGGLSATGQNGTGGSGLGTGGDPGTPGGGVLNRGTLTLRNVSVTQNVTGDGGDGGSGTGGTGGAGQMGGNGSGGPGGPGGPGGGVFTSSTLKIENSSVTQNRTGTGGNGGTGTGGASGNANAGDTVGPTGGQGAGGKGGDGGEGGGVASTGPATITGSTISDNDTGNSGGGFGGFASGGAAGAGSGNKEGGVGGTGFGGNGGGGGPGGGVVALGAAVTIERSLVAGNTAGDGSAPALGSGGAGGTGGSTNATGGAGGPGVGGTGGPGGDGGGLATVGGGDLTARNVTVNGNSAGSGRTGGLGFGGSAGFGGGSGARGIGGNAFGGPGGRGGLGGGTALTAGTFLVTHGTLAANSAPATGGGGGSGVVGAGASPGTLTPGTAGSPGNGGGAHGGVVGNAIIAGNTPNQCNGTSDGGRDIAFNDATCPGATVADPKLGPLADNGGATRTRRLLPGSAAINSVNANPAICQPVDQRGVKRPQGPACDAGAYERALPTLATAKADRVIDYGARLNGSLNPHTADTTFKFEYGRTTSYGRSVTHTIDDDSDASRVVRVTVRGLKRKTTFHFRLVATNPDGTTTGADQRFKTPGHKCGGKNATIVDTPGGHKVKGTKKRDVIVTLGGNDTARAGKGNDVVCLGSGNDKGFGGPGNDRMFGQSGKDRLSGDAGNDKLFGGGAKDRLFGGRGNDVLFGGSAFDRLFGGGGHNTIHQ